MQKKGEKSNKYRKAEDVFFTPKWIVDATIKKIHADYQKKYRKKNPDKIKKHIKKYRETHKEEYRKYLLNYYTKNKEKIIKNRKKSPKSKLAKLSEKNRGRGRRGFMRSEIIKKLGNKCALCGHSETDSLVIDHKIPISRYLPNIQKTYSGFKKGTTNLENLQILCGNCNVKKANRFTFSSKKA